uniref:Zgc:123107 n=1 Tax=Lepisosteus oculatus TaxID=7918 RepID=W5MKC8_LEPOC
KAVFILFFSLYDINCKTSHIDINVIGCKSDDPVAQDEAQLDGDEMFYADFDKKEMILTLPAFADSFGVDPGWVQGAIANRQICINNLEVAIKAENNPPENTDAPVNTIYPRDEVELGKPNTLICLANNFFPPPVKVRWTKNDVDVSEQATLSRYYPNSDATFYQFSTLSFTPQLGDVYSCSVEHKALPEPKTRIWGEERLQVAVAPELFC